MDGLRECGLVDTVHRVVARETPFLGICIGMQILFSESIEFGRVRGLDILKGRVISFDPAEIDGGKIPHMGWNQLHIKRRAPHLDGIPDGASVYFVHSFYPVPDNSDVIATTTDYGGTEFVSSVWQRNVFATQFHPEKSQDLGLRILANFGQLVTAKTQRSALSTLTQFDMLIIPAIDLKGGRCVRLYQGDMDRATVYSDDPVATARRWQSEGAERLHVVDLDGAVSGIGVNTAAIEQICAVLTIPVQVGGGIRTIATAEQFFASGVRRFILGTIAYRRPGNFSGACRRFPGRITVGIDARAGKVAVQGWTEATDSTLLHSPNNVRRWAWAKLFIRYCAGWHSAGRQCRCNTSTGAYCGAPHY